MTQPNRHRALYASAAWTIAWLALFDLGTSLAVRAVAARNPASGLVRYFEYGRSTESKLDRTLAQPVDSADALVERAGWLDPTEWASLPDRPGPGANALVAVYGQSFAANATIEAARLDGHLTLRLIGGPAAPADHSHAIFVLDAPLRKADVVVMGVLASSVARIGAMSQVSYSFEQPAPYTFPHYTVSDGELHAEAPAFTSEAEFRRAFSTRSSEWDRFKDQLAANDRGFDRIAFDRTPLDASQLVLLMRRGWVAHHQNYEDGVRDPRSGFNPNAEPVGVLNALLRDASRRARARNERLIVLLEHDRGYADHLYKAVAGTLQAENIEFVSSHTLFSSSDPANFIANGHYTDAANQKFALALARLIRLRPAAGRR